MVQEVIELRHHSMRKCIYLLHHEAVYKHPGVLEEWSWFAKEADSYWHLLQHSSRSSSKWHILPFIDSSRIVELLHETVHSTSASLNLFRYHWYLLSSVKAFTRTCNLTSPWAGVLLSSRQNDFPASNCLRVQLAIQADTDKMLTCRCTSRDRDIKVYGLTSITVWLPESNRTRDLSDESTKDIGRGHRTDTFRCVGILSEWYRCQVLNAWPSNSMISKGPVLNLRAARFGQPSDRADVTNKQLVCHRSWFDSWSGNDIESLCPCSPCWFCSHMSLDSCPGAEGQNSHLPYSFLPDHEQRIDVHETAHQGLYGHGPERLICFLLSISLRGVQGCGVVAAAPWAKRHQGCGGIRRPRTCRSYTIWASYIKTKAFHKCPRWWSDECPDSDRVPHPIKADSESCLRYWKAFRRRKPPV